MHQIEEYDITGSLTSPEWHGLARVLRPEQILEFARKLCFPIVFGESTFTVDGVSFPLTDENGKGWKIMAADCRNLPVLEGRAVHPPAIVPLHVPKQDYTPIENGRVLDAIAAAFEHAGIGYQISTIGTLDNLRRFYVSVSMDQSLGIVCPKGFDILDYICFHTSHSGNGFDIYDSLVKPVCANTVDGGMRQHGDIKMNIRHTKNAELEIVELEKTLGEFMKGAADLNFALANLQSIEVSTSTQEQIAAGYFLEGAIRLGVSRDKLLASKMTTNSLNATREIVRLAAEGKGNDGKTAYDLYNGATDYWSNGAGVGGDKVGIAKRVFRSRFGSAASHKREFGEYIFSDERRSIGIELAGKILSN